MILNLINPGENFMAIDRGLLRKKKKLTANFKRKKGY
jgi:hypothetical protein